MAKSLDDLSKNLSDEECNNLRWFFHDNFKIMRRKGVYPYKYIYIVGISLKRRHYHLKKHSIASSVYKISLIKTMTMLQQVWDLITPEGDHITLGDYHDVYLVTDVLLLADVFDTFRGMCLKNYRLDPAHFYTAPGLAWQAALKYTGVKPELLTDYDMLLMFEKGIRGGITSTSTCSTSSISTC